MTEKKKARPCYPIGAKEGTRARERSAKANAGAQFFIYFEDGSNARASGVAAQIGVVSSTVILRYRRLRAKGVPVTIETLKQRPSK